MDWQPIYTAPKDGTEFLAYDATVNKMDVAYMIEWRDGEYKCVAVQSDGEYGPEPDQFCSSWQNKITHWKPLPEPPTT